MSENGFAPCRIFFTRTLQAPFRKKFYGHLVLLASLLRRFHGSQRQTLFKDFPQVISDAIFAGMRRVKG